MKTFKSYKGLETWIFKWEKMKSTQGAATMSDLYSNAGETINH